MRFDPSRPFTRSQAALAGLSLRELRTVWDAKIAIEYDGRQHIERVDQWESDLVRRESIDDDGWRLLVVTSRGIYLEPEATLRRIARLARSRGVAGVPARLREDWRPHFPGQ